jgi:hypothetical protein
MTEAPAPDSDAWLETLIERSPLLPDPDLQRHWRTLIPWLSPELRYQLAGTLIEAERALG